MQINPSPRQNTGLIKSFMVGLVASSMGAFVAFPSTAMPEPGDAAAAETIESPEAIEDTTVESSEAVDKLPTPTAEEKLPSPEATLEAADEEMPTEGATAADLMGDPTETGLEATELAEDEALDADADITDEAVEADAEMTDETVEADAEMTDDETVVESDTDDTEAADVGEELDTENLTIAEVANAGDSFTILATALAAADMTEVLEQEGPYTVFAPTDEAFEALPEGVLEQLLLPENQAVLIQILSYHVVQGEILSADLESGNIATVEGSDITVDAEDADAVTVNNANVLLPDVVASNGVIHAIDQVIVPLEPAAGAEVESPEPAAIK